MVLGRVLIVLWLLLHISLGLSAGAQPIQCADTSMMAKVVKQKRLDSIADLFPVRYYSYRDYDEAAMSQLTVFGRVPAGVTRRSSGALTMYVVTMDTAGYDINLSTMDSAQAKIAIESIEMVLYHDTLIKAAVYYDDNKGDLWEKWYFDDHTCFLGTALPFNILLQANLNFNEFPLLVDKIRKLK
jgi:hypothetical protein